MSMWQDIYETFLEAEHNARQEEAQEDTTEKPSAELVPKAVHIFIQLEERSPSANKESLTDHYKALERIFGPEAVEALKRAIQAQQPPAESSDDQEEA